MRLSRHHQIVLLTTATVALLAAQSVALASHQFRDVPHSSPHAPGIGYVAERGITQGCTSQDYCPGDALTRAQMGTFLFRASGNDPATPPSVNAQRLQGRSAADFRLASEPVNAATLQGKSAADFRLTSEPVDAATLQGRSAAQLVAGGSYWAYVISNGGLHASSGGITVTHPATGVYCVVIPKEPAHKAAQVTLADPGGNNIVSVGTGHGSACNPLSTSTNDAVPVTIKTAANAAVDGNFTIVVPRTTLPPG